jgi:hypothetical protein
MLTLPMDFNANLFFITYLNRTCLSFNPSSASLTNVDISGDSVVKRRHSPFHKKKKRRSQIKIKASLFTL